jgi:hypothetical protein
MAEQKQRFSFSQAAAQQPQRQRFSFSQYAPAKKPSYQEVVDKALPTRELIRGIPYATLPKPTASEVIARDKARGTTISAAPEKKQTPVGYLVSKLPQPVQDFTEGARKMLAPTRSEQVVRAFEEDPNRTDAQLTQRANELDTQSGIVVAGGADPYKESNRTNLGFVDGGVSGSIKNIIRKLAGETSETVIRKTLKEAVGNIKLQPSQADQLIKRIAKTSDEAEVSRLLKNITPSTQPTPDIGTIRDAVVRRLEKPVPLNREGFKQANILESGQIGPRVDQVVANLKKTPEPTVAQLNEAVEALRLSGRQVDDIVEELNTYTKNLPETYTQRAGAMDIKPPTKRFSFSEMATTARQNLRNPAMRQGGYAGQVPDSFPKPNKLDNQVVSFIDDTIDPKNFNTAEEFVNALGKKYNPNLEFDAGLDDITVPKEVVDFYENKLRFLDPYQNFLLPGEKKDVKKVVEEFTNIWNQAQKTTDSAVTLGEEILKRGEFDKKGNLVKGPKNDSLMKEIDTRLQAIKTPTQTANAERAEQVIKRQRKPEEVAKEAAETKKWEADPVKAQAESTQEVAKKYSNTVADQGFISEGAARIDGVPPVKNVTAKARNFAKNNDTPIDLPPETWSQYFLTQVQDTAYRLGLVQKNLNKAGVKISDDANAYLQREAYIGRASAKIEKKRKELGMVAGNKKGLFMRMKRDGVKVEDLAEYMSAKNAADRNKRVAGIKDGVPDGGSGLTNAEAAEILAKYKGNDAMEAYAKEFRESVITPRLQLLKEAGILTDEQIANITKYEPNYVPSKVAEFDRIQGGGTGFSVQGSGVKGLRGSARKDRTNSVMQAVSDYEDAIQRAEKNKSLQSMGELIKQNPDKTLWEVKGVQYVPQYNEVGELQFLRQREINPKTSVEFWKDGKAYEIRIHDEALAQVFTQEGLWKPIGFLRQVNNYLRAVNTVINPEFMITNALRDLQTALVIAGGEKGVVTAAKMVADYPKATKGIWQAVRNESNEGWSKIYNEMVDAGGRTGWFDLKEVAESTKEVSKLVNRYNSTKASDSLMRAVDGTAKLISDVNEAAEMSVRVSAYKQLVDSGMSKVKAANYAKNMTVNFNKRGNIGMFANSLYLFANAGIQGSARLLMALKYPKVRRITYGIVASSYAINELNNKINPEGYNRIQDFEKERNLIVMLPLDGNNYNLPGVSGDPSTGYYFKVPLPYGFNVFKVAGDAAYDLVNQKKTSGEVMKQMLLAIDASFNPLSSGTPTQFISPTVTDPFISSWENKNWFGAPIMPEQPAFAPAVRDSDRYFSGARDLSVETAQFLNRLTGGNEVTSGAVDISPETIDHIIDSIGGGLGNFLGQSADGAVNVVKGDIPTPEEMPFVRKFIDTPFEKGEQSQVFNLLEKSATKQMSQIEIDRFVDNTITALERGDIDTATAKRVTDQFIDNTARQYAGEVLSLINEGNTNKAMEVISSAPPAVIKELNKLVKDDVEREIKRLESQQK